MVWLGGAWSQLSCKPRTACRVAAPRKASHLPGSWACLRLHAVRLSRAAMQERTSTAEHWLCRILSLHNAEGELLEAFGGSRNPLPPVIKQLTYTQLPGTSPGNTVYLHHPSGVLFAGDTVFTKAGFERRSKPQLVLPLTQARAVLTSRVAA